MPNKRNRRRKSDKSKRPQYLKESSVTVTKNKIKRYREKIKQKKLEKNNKLYEELNAKDFGNFQDQVKFGEVVQAPPSITTIPKSRQNKVKKIKNFEKTLFMQNST
ncbi:6669_t:CDS:2 [Diversispora eburnea]|uniref:6669_t:CDS:1 n=1 Tax=Diversispora eburnea TaxID=1213867 RepID=A0A9N9G118_9GLOM|nr:6669_t:CDS:2 [Diversispora eburnea]